MPKPNWSKPIQKNPVERIGIDLGGTKIEAIALSPSGQELLRERQTTPTGDYAGTLMAIQELLQQVEQQLGVNCSVGIGTPGSLSPATGLMRNANSTCLNGKPFLADIEQLLQRPIRMANDADCFALSEAVDGAGAEANTVFGVIIGTGTGGGIVINKQLVSGPNAITGEWGHNPLPWPSAEELPGPACYCGKHACIETFLSGPGLQADYLLHAGKQLTAEEITRLSDQGDEAAEAVLQAYEDRMARSLASVINILDPEVIILGGGLSNLQRLYSNVPQIWQQYIFSDTVSTRLLPPLHGDSSGVRGAAWLWPG